MTRLLGAELRRVRATPVTWWLLLGTVAIGVLGTLAPLIAVDGKAVDLLGDRQLRTSLHGAAGGSILVVVAGIIGMAGEWRFGQASQAFLTTPRRWRVVTVKATLFAAAPSVFRWLPATASLSLRGQPSDDLLTAGPAGGVLLGLIAVTMVAGVRVVERSDVTG